LTTGPSPAGTPGILRKGRKNFKGAPSLFPLGGLSPGEIWRKEKERT